MIFGTDGIRARTGQAPMDRETIEKLGQVLADWLPTNGSVVLASDTRASCSAIKNWVLCAMDGIAIHDLGVAPTPVAAFETKARGADLGIMITASHNPAEDNGLKFFDSQGLKIPYRLAQQWSQRVENGLLKPGSPGRLETAKATAYRDFILDTFSQGDFSGLSFCFDLANGAGTGLIPELIEALQIEAKIIGNEPDGSNINLEVGALHPDKLEKATQTVGTGVGFALDGDGDRLVVVAGGRALPGDIALYALCKVYRNEGIDIPAVVGTILCGMGLENALASEGVSLIRTPVGDQNVLAELVSRDLKIGGEPSGHIIQGDLFPAGDGFLAALRMAKALKHNPGLFQEATAAVPMFPVHEKAYLVRHKPPLEEVSGFEKWKTQTSEKLSDRGRLIVRYSGTEPKIRLYLEADDLTPFQDEIGAFENLVTRELA